MYILSSKINQQTNAELWIRIHHFEWIRIQGFDQKLQFTYVQATEEAFSPQKRTSCTLKNEIY